MMENYSLSDIRAATGDNGFGMGNDSLIWLVVLFLFFGGNFGNRGFGEAATAAAQNEILLGQQFGGVNDKLNQIGNGICDSTYAITNAVTNEGRNLQSQLAECCCNTQLAIKGLEAKMDANEIQNLRDKVTDLQLRASQCDQNAYLVNQLRPCPVPAYLTCSPYQTYGGCGFNGYQPNI